MESETNTDKSTVENNDIITTGSKALVIGGTGAIGKCLVKELLESPKWSKVTTIGRRKGNFPENSKLEQIVVDMDRMEESKDKFIGHDVSFCCLGTTRKDAGSAEAFKKVDLEYVTNFAKLSKDVGIKHFLHVTSYGSNKNSWFLYPQTKGQAEENVNNLHFNTTVVLRPGLLGRGTDSRFVEKVAAIVAPVMPVEKVARAMRIKAENQLASSIENIQVEILYNKEIFEWAKK